jgi:Flp pilus assembly protein TadD
LRQRVPDYPGLHLNYGGALLDAGKLNEALVEFDAAIAQGSPTAKLLHLRAVTLAELGRRAEAIDAVRQVLNLDPRYAPALGLERQLEASRK